MGSGYIENLDEIESRLDVEQVLDFIQPGKTKKISGGELRTSCPRHGLNDSEAGQNFSINLKTHEWKCHSRDCRGKNLISLHKQCTKNSSYKESAIILANHFGIQIRYREKSTTIQILTPQEIWDSSSPTGNHSYLNKKKVQACPGLRFGKDAKGNYSIVVPFHNIDNELQTVQFVNEHGKFFLQGRSSSGAFFKIGEIKDRVYLAEGLATALTIWEALGIDACVISCGSCGNIPSVVDALKNRYPNIDIVVCLDDNDAAINSAKKIRHKCSYRKPSFERSSYPEGQEPKDFNDIISMCNHKLEDVQKQLAIEFDISTANLNSKTECESNMKDSLYNKLGKLIGDVEFVSKLQDRNYDAFEKEHMNLFKKGGLITGYEKIDEQLYFSKGDFVIAQAMSNHGKSTFMLQLAYKFLCEEENKNKDPMCIFITYESNPLRIEEKFVNIIGHESKEGTIILFDKNSEEKFLYADRKENRNTIDTFNTLQSQNKIHILKRIPLEKLEEVIKLYKTEYPNRTLVLFLDYIQIIETSLDSVGWERIKAIAYRLESLAIKHEIIIFSACQVNENRQTREGRDIYNAATTVLDILNHSHTSLKSNSDLLKLHKPQINEKSVCTFSVFKQKHGSSFELQDYFLFNGYNFEENKKNNSVKQIGLFG